MDYLPSKVITHENADAQLVAGTKAILAGQSTISFKQTNHVDSTAVACIVGWQRAAQQNNHSVTFEDLPPSLVNLMELYGVSKIL